MAPVRTDYQTAPVEGPLPLDRAAARHVEALERAQGKLKPGATIEQAKSFEIVERLGEGGMGLVYKAYDPSMDRYIALKVLKAGVPESQRARFEREAVIAANFSHPNLVRVLEIGRSGPLHWLAMEYLRGRDIGEVIGNRKAIAFRVLVDIFSQSLDALHYIHTRKIAHCDIKPENIFVTRDAYDRRLVLVKLIDFGIARSYDGPLELQTHITGDPRYMAPEQSVINTPLDHRADLYSLGLTFYECLTRRHPFEDWWGEAPRELLRLQREQEIEPPSLFLPPNTPPPLAAAADRFLLRACAKAPKDRFQSAPEMQGAMKLLLEHLE